MTFVLNMMLVLVPHGGAD